jgi:hypothetical protein
MHGGDQATLIKSSAGAGTVGLPQKAPVFDSLAASRPGMAAGLLAPHLRSALRFSGSRLVGSLHAARTLSNANPLEGRLERQMTAMSQRVHALMTKLPGDINPLNLEELRRIKQDLVQLENKADQVGGGVSWA